LIEHELGELLAQRIYGLALGYEDVNDHEELRRDPLLALRSGKRKLEEPLASKSTLNRLELTPAGSPLDDRYHKITYSTEARDALLVDIFLEAHAKAPRQMVLGCRGQAALWPTGRSLFPWLLQRVRLPTAVHLLRRSPVVRAATHLQPGCQRRQRGRGRAHRQPDPIDARESAAPVLFLPLAYVLVHALRRLALAGTQWAQAQVHTIRLRLLKIAAEVRLSLRRIWVTFSNAYPWKDIFAAAWIALRC